MLREETVYHYALFAFHAQAFFRNERINPEQMKDLIENATTEARRLLSTMPYDEMCENMRKQIIVVHDAKIPGIGKLTILKELAAEDPERFGKLLTNITADEIIEDALGLRGFNK